MEKFQQGFREVKRHRKLCRAKEDLKTSMKFLASFVVGCSSSRTSSSADSYRLMVTDIVLRFSVEMSPINLDRIQSWIDQGRIDPTRPITLKELADSRCLHGVKDGVKLLARGRDDLKTPINILVSRASATAIEAVEALGGKVTTRYYTKPAIRRILKGESVSSFTPLSSADANLANSPILDAALLNSSPFSYRLPDPTSRKDIEYYRDPAHRGYLSHTVEEGQGPSLFFKPPRTGKFHKKSKKTGTAAVARENRIW
jgi:large subunit ribosomal protein L15